MQNPPFWFVGITTAPDFLISLDVYLKIGYGSLKLELNPNFNLQTEWTRKWHFELFFTTGVVWMWRGDPSQEVENYSWNNYPWV